MPEVHPAVVGGMEPSLEAAWTVVGAVQNRRPLKQPENVNSEPEVCRRPSADDGGGERADLDLDCDRDSID